MLQSVSTYTPNDLAKMYHLHSNTIRLYEKLNYISPALREKNNYRVFTDHHVLQVKICRCIFGYPFTNRRIRDAGNEVMYASARCQSDNGKQLANKYVQTIQYEIDIATLTANMLHEWKNSNNNLLEGQFLSRKQVAEYFGITTETVRNWERNALICSCGKNEVGETTYSEGCLEKMRIVYMLRQAGFSMSAIHRSLDKETPEQALISLNNPTYDELVSVGDQWILGLKKLLNAAIQIPIIFLELEKL